MQDGQLAGSCCKHRQLSSVLCDDLVGRRAGGAGVQEGRHYIYMVAQMVKNLPEMEDTWVQLLGWEDPLEKEMAPHSIILAWKIPWTEEPGGLQPMGLQRVKHD